MTDRLSDLDPFTVHDPGCHCWPHVSESALSEAVIAGAVDEYRASKATIATLRAALPLDWCGHNEQIWDLTKALDDAESTIATLNGIIDLNNADIHDRDEALVMVRASVVKQREEIATLRAALDGLRDEVAALAFLIPGDHIPYMEASLVLSAIDRAALATAKEAGK